MITRFAPSPTGPLHLGHAFSAFQVWSLAEHFGGTALLRIEDTDSTRVRPEFEAGIYDDLRWMGLSWPEPVRKQSNYYNDYWSTLNELEGFGVLYPCSCNRRAIQTAGATAGPDGLIYPGTCSHRQMSDRIAGDAIRLNLRKALEIIEGSIRYIELRSGGPEDVETTAEQLFSEIGDPVVRRKETGDPAYHLACTHDDALQGVTHVVRGVDVQGLTPIHVVLQRLIGWPTPFYLHHDLIVDENGKRLAKVNKSMALAKMREEGATLEDIRSLLNLP